MYDGKEVYLVDFDVATIANKETYKKQILQILWFIYEMNSAKSVDPKRIRIIPSLIAAEYGIFKGLAAKLLLNEKLPLQDIINYIEENINRDSDK